MDSRPSQGPSRPLHASASQSSHPAAYPPQYGPPTASQPPVHVPFSDPFQHRDPFLPSAQQRRGSYGLQGTAERGWGNSSEINQHHHHHHHHGHSHSQSQPHVTSQSQSQQRPHQNSAPPPPPPNLASVSASAASSASASASAPFPPFESSQRRRSLGGGASPPHYYAAARDPPPPPPSFTSRHMPPPSSPQQAAQLPPYPGQRAPPPPPFSSGRDLPGLVGPPRPNSNMSISSLMGIDPAAAAARQSHYSPTSTTAPSPSLSAMQPPSPRRSLIGGARIDYPQYRRPETPDQYPPGGAARVPDRAAYPAGSPRPFGPPAMGSPEVSRQGLSSAPQSAKPASLHESRPYYHASPADSAGNDLSRQPGPAIPPRPNSQPTGPLAGPPPTDARLGYGAASERRPLFGLSEEERRAAQDNQYQARPAGPSTADISRLDASGRERPSTVQPLSHTLFDRPESRVVQPPAAGQPPRGGLFWHPQPRVHVAGEPYQQAQEEHREPFPPGPRNVPGSGPPQLMGLNRASINVHNAPAEQSQRFPMGPEARRGPEHYQSPPTSDPSSLDRRRPEAAGPTHNSYGARSSSYEYHGKPEGADMQKSRSFLGVSPEARRTGRASPLPQAVQGAQAQPVVPGGDPSIKNEFGRMFSGLGSGLVSAPSTHGSATPGRGSPFQQNGDSNGDLDVLGRAGSRGARRRRVKDEEGRPENDMIDGRVTPGAMSQRNAKRPKYTHPAGHHHHHLYTHHHHHRPEEEQLAIANLQAATTPISFSKMNGVQAQTPVAAPTHHHHHHHHAPHPPHHHHHHHHAPRPPTATAQIPLTKPIVELNSQKVIEKVKDLPRHHLGSVIYEATTAPPPSKNTSIDDRYGFRSIPAPLPDASGKEGCTITVRVPRYYLTERQRDVVCCSKHLWGTDVYTNDSDVVAAAIHSGWIRGAWAEDVDVSLLDPRIGGEETAKEADPNKPLTTKPEYPAVPPADMDVHITVLIVPALTSYKSTVCYGIKSRSRKAHTGSSYKIERVEWVDDEGTKRGEERNGKARRERLAAAQSLVALLTGVGRDSSGNKQQMKSEEQRMNMQMGTAQAVA